MDPTGLCTPGTFLLYPGTPGDWQAQPPQRLLVLDGSWGQVRGMVRRWPVLSQLPRMPVPPLAETPLRLRRQHREDGLSTLEAIAQALRLLEGDAVAEPLLALYQEFSARGWAARGGYRAKMEGTPSGRSEA